LECKLTPLLGCLLFFLKDCDGDTDCAFGLICFQRDLGEKDVPGCSGDADLVGDGFDDFCIKPQTANTLVVVGDEDIPASAFPLGECQGGKIIIIVIIWRA
jgi:hypothetical protein